MLLLRDTAQTAAAHHLAAEHTALVDSNHRGTADLAAVHADKLVATLAAAAESKLYLHTYDDALRAGLPKAGDGDPAVVMREIFPALPLLGKGDLATYGSDAFTRPLTEFLHYYE